MGSRNKVSELFLEDFYDVWKRKGKQALEYIADNEQVRFVAAAVQILPRDFQLTVDAEQVNWVICATPGLDEAAWRKKNGLENGAPVKNNAPHNYAKAITIDQEKDTSESNQ